MVLFHIGFVNICCFIFVIVIRIQSWISFIEWNSIKLKYLLNLNVFMNIYEKSVTPLITVILLMFVCDNTNLSVFPNDNINHAVLSGHFYNFL